MGTCSFVCHPLLPVPVPAKKHHSQFPVLPKIPFRFASEGREPRMPVGGLVPSAEGPGVGDVPSRALTPSTSPRPGRLAVRYRMYRQVQLPWYCRAGPALQQRRCPHHCRCHQGMAITAPRPHPRISMGCWEHLCVAQHCICHASGIPSSRWKSRRASRAGIGPCARLINSQPC